MLLIINKKTMTHLNLVTEVYKMRFFFPELEKKTWGELLKVSDSELITYLEQNDSFIEDRKVDLNLN